MPPDDYEYMCPRDLSAVARGYELRMRGEWNRTLAVVNMWSTKPVTFDDITGRSPTKNTIRSKEEWEKFKQQFGGK